MSTLPAVLDVAVMLKGTKNGPTFASILGNSLAIHTVSHTRPDGRTRYFGGLKITETTQHQNGLEGY